MPTPEEGLDIGRRRKANRIAKSLIHRFGNEATPEAVREWGDQKWAMADALSKFVGDEASGHVVIPKRAPSQVTREMVIELLGAK